MGLDMYLEGEKFSGYSAPKVIEDGFEVKRRVLDLGYWRKHPNLHGYIVNTFASGIDDCGEIDLDAKDITQIIEAIQNGALPVTTGFFFGTSNGSEKEEDLAIFNKALDWLNTQDEGSYKSITYRASW